MKVQKRKYRTGGIYKPKGCKNWTIYYSLKRKRYRVATGTSNYATAQQILLRRVGSVANGDAIDPKIEKIKVTDLWGPFLLDRENEGRGLEYLKMRWRKHVEPFFAQYRAADVGTDLMNEYIKVRRDEQASNATINREIAVLRGMLRLGFYSKPQKLKSLPKFPRLDESLNVRTGFLDPQKYQALADNASKIGIWMRAIFEIAYTWGWRKSELNMQVRQVDFNANVVRLDPGMTKNKKGREVTMTPTIHALLVECARGKQANDALFTRENGTAVNDFSVSWRRLRVAAGVPHLLLHDLRRTAVRNLVRAGVPEHTAMAISGHKTRSVFDRYDIVDQRDIANAMLKLEEHAGREIVTKSVTIDPAERLM
jgi:integrase